MVSRAPRLGVVSSFDEQAGCGVVRGDDGQEMGFHCTAIVDATRTIDPGVRVAYVVSAGAPGKWEAAAIVKLP